MFVSREPLELLKPYSFEQVKKDTLLYNQNHR